VPDEPKWIIEPLAKRHDRAAFSCGVKDLDSYLHRYAGQNQSAGISQHFVAVGASGQSRVLGYYALSAGAVAFKQMPAELRKRLPRYPIPVAHLGRMAVDESMHGHGLGEDLLIDALTRVVDVSDEIGVHAVEVVAINDKARSFYLKYGFTALADDKNHLYLPLSVAKQLGLSQ